MSGGLTLLYTNDLHGALDAARADWLAARKAEWAPCLLLDAGDAVTCGNVGWHRGGEPAHRHMARAGYDAGAMGNREFHFRPGPQARKAAAADFPLLCANLARADGGPLPEPIAPRCRFPLAAREVVCFGLMIEMIPRGHWCERFSPFRHEPAEAAAAREVERAGGRLVICLSHLGLERDRKLAAAVPGLDLILGGHSHTPLAEPELVGATRIFQNEPHGGGLTRIELPPAGRPGDPRWERLRFPES